MSEEKKPLGIFRDANGDWSSKRVIAFLSFIVAGVVAIVTRDAVLTGVFMGATLGILGVQATTKT